MWGFLTLDGLVVWKVFRRKAVERVAGGLAFLFTGDLVQVVISLGASLVCFGLTAPREEWFEEAGVGRDSSGSP